jgi:hypothetical protein
MKCCSCGTEIKEGERVVFIVPAEVAEGMSILELIAECEVLIYCDTCYMDVTSGGA